MDISDVSDWLPSVEGLPDVILHALTASHSEDTLNLRERGHADGRMESYPGIGCRGARASG